MKILLLSFYYPPDLCAGSFRAGALARALREAGGDEVEVDVITTMPNRYASHQQEALEFETSDRVCVRRIPLSAHRSGMLDQSRAFLDYARGVQRHTEAGRWDIVVATSSRLMTAALGAQVAKRLGAALYLDIRDIFTDTMSDLLVGRTLRCVLPGLRWLERRTLRAADRINLVSPGFLPHVRKLTNRTDFALFPNGIDEEFLHQNFSLQSEDSHALPLVLYAGNIGDGQGLHHVVPGAARELIGRARFRIIGDGGRMKALQDAVVEAGVGNVELVAPVSRMELVAHYQEADALLLHLNDHDSFLKVLPSKIFEYGATGKPLLAGVAGYAAEFIAESLPDAWVFRPCDANGLAAGVRALASSPAVFDRTEFRSRFARRHIMRAMASDVLSVPERIRGG